MDKGREGRIVWGMVIVLLFLHPNLDLQAAKAPRLFEVGKLLDIEIKGEITTIIRDNGENRGYHPATVIYQDASGRAVEIAVEIKTRGRFRRDPRNCNFAPLFLRFKKDAVKKTIFKGIKRLKLVTHCQSKKTIYEQYMLREYLVYRLFNILTEASFRVRLLNITYTDTARKGRQMKKMGFFIEPVEMVAERNKATYWDIEKNPKYSIDSKQSCFLSVFQFMVGNTDWSFIADHNVKRILPADGPTIGVPYDFDYAGIVRAHYAVPIEKVKSTSTKDRYFQGFCQEDSVYASVFSRFNDREKAFYSLYETFPHISKSYRKKTIKFLDKFFKIINTPSLVKRYIHDKCVERSRL
jgi:hypothetical protein